MNDLMGHAVAAAATRKLVAVLAADIANYTRMMESAEQEAYAQLVQIETDIAGPALQRFGGHLVKRTGDGFLAIFDSAMDALDCGLTIQSALLQRAVHNPAHLQALYRIGLHIADIYIEQNDIYGDGVNVAARLQSFAEPGSMVVSGSFYDQVGSRNGIVALDLGPLLLRNTTRPTQVYSLRPEGFSPPNPAAAAQHALPSIAVLPFQYDEANGTARHFGLGLNEAIGHVLAGLRDVFVVSHGSTLPYAGAAQDPRVVGRELGVRYVLQGRLRTNGTIRTVTELSDTNSGMVLQSNQHTTAKADLFELQDRISAEIVAAIAPNVREQELRRAMRKHPGNMSAYDFMVQALDRLHRFEKPAFIEAGGLLAQAIAHDQGYAPVRSYMAWWHVLRESQGWSSDPSTDRVEAERHSAAAVNLDQNDFLALAIRGHCMAWRRDYAASKDDLDRAVAVGPNSALAWSLRGLTVGFLGQADEAVLCGERAQRLAPLDPFAYFHQSLLAQAYYFSGQVDRAIALAQQVAARREPFTSNLRLLAVALSAAGRKTEAREAASRLLAADPRFRLSSFAARTVLPGPMRDEYVLRLREAGIED